MSPCIAAEATRAREIRETESLRMIGSSWSFQSGSCCRSFYLQWQGLDRYLSPNPALLLKPSNHLQLVATICFYLKVRRWLQDSKLDFMDNSSSTLECGNQHRQSPTMQRGGTLLVFSCICRTKFIAWLVSLLDRKALWKKFSFTSKALDWKVCLNSDGFFNDLPRKSCFPLFKRNTCVRWGTVSGLKPLSDSLTLNYTLPLE